VNPERLERDEGPTPVGSSSSGIKSHRSLDGLDSRSDKTQKILEWAIGIAIGFMVIGVLVGWFGGFLYMMHLWFGS
jgi:hypothetical protein